MRGVLGIAVQFTLIAIVLAGTGSGIHAQTPGTGVRHPASEGSLPAASQSVIAERNASHDRFKLDLYVRELSLGKETGDRLIWHDTAMSFGELPPSRITVGPDGKVPNTYLKRTVDTVRYGKKQSAFFLVRIFLTFVFLVGSVVFAVRSLWLLIKKTPWKNRLTAVMAGAVSVLLFNLTSTNNLVSVVLDNASENELEVVVDGKRAASIPPKSFINTTWDRYSVIKLEFLRRGKLVEKATVHPEFAQGRVVPDHGQVIYNFGALNHYLHEQVMYLPSGR